MFALNLNAGQRESLVRICSILATVDGTFCDEENDFIANLSEYLGLVEVNHSVSFEDSLSAFTSNKDKIILLIDLINLAYVDNDYSANEKDFIDNVATSLNIESDKLRAIEEWICQGRRWQEQGELLINN